jgi:NTE family protein
VFCATDMVFGVSWVFERRRVGSYQAGYLVPAPHWPVAKAVAASSCFPPVFAPLPINAEPGQVVVEGTGKPKEEWAGMSVSDGGLYDNLGLQPAERHGVVLVSDGGQPFVAAVPRGLFFWLISPSRFMHPSSLLSTQRNGFRILCGWMNG